MKRRAPRTLVHFLAPPLTVRLRAFSCRTTNAAIHIVNFVTLVTIVLLILIVLLVPRQIMNMLYELLRNMDRRPYFNKFLLYEPL